MPFQLRRPLCALAAAGLVLAVVGCSQVTPLGPDPVPVSLSPARDLGSPIVMQIMRSQPPTPAGQCPAGSIALFGSEPDVPRTSAVSPVLAQPVQGGTATPAAASATPPAPGTGAACYRPVGTPVTITSAALSSVTTNRNQPGPAWYEFVVAFPAADVPALTALIRQAYTAGDAVNTAQIQRAPGRTGKPAQQESSPPALPPAGPVTGAV
jgi:hypothetical protein